MVRASASSAGSTDGSKGPTKEEAGTEREDFDEDFAALRSSTVAGGPDLSPEDRSSLRQGLDTKPIGTASEVVDTV